MEAINVSELKAAKNFSTFNDLSTDASESSNMKQAIDDFVVESKGKLKGEVWDTISGQLGQFSEALSERMQLANRLSAAIQEALDILINYIGDDYDSLDYSKLPELITNKQRCMDSIISIKGTISKLSKMASTEGADNNTNVSYYYGLLNSYESELAELEKLIDKLEGLKEKYVEAEKILSSAFEEVSEVASKVASISVGKAVTFSV